ncbi:MAG: hypothetical protein ACI4XJ_03155 [Eubacteriales bacterium]
MSDNRFEAAKNVYDKLCEVFDKRDITYHKDDENMVVNLGITGDDLPMDFVMIIDEKRQLMRLMSPLPFRMPEDKRLEGAIAACAATYAITEGSFDYDISDGSISFRMTASFIESDIGEDLFMFMVAYASTIVDEYNDKFFMIGKGLLGISDFLEQI